MREYYVETKQVIYRDCRVMAETEKEAMKLVLEGKAGLVEERAGGKPVVSNAWPIATNSKKL